MKTQISIQTYAAGRDTLLAMLRRNYLTQRRKGAEAQRG